MKQNKKEYISSEIEIIRLTNKDIITSSSPMPKLPESKGGLKSQGLNLFLFSDIEE